MAIAAIGSASAQNGQALIDVHASAYRYIDAIFLEQGLATPSKARPWSKEELRKELARIDPSALSEAARQAYRYLERLAGSDAPSGDLEGRAGIGLSPEAFIKIPLAGNPAGGTGADWLHGFEARPALLDIPLELWLGRGFYAILDASIREDHASVGSPGNYSNLILDDPNPRIDLYFPFKAYSAVGGDGWSIRFGRDSLSWGNGQSGNLFLSDYSDFYDYIGLALYGKSLKLSSVYSIFDSYDPKTLQHTVYSALMAHRLDVRLFDRLLLSINEAVTFGGDDEPELIRDLNFMMIFHNWTIPLRTNSLLSVELNYTPWRWFEVYAQVAMDEFMTKYESDRDGNGGPPIFGYMAGIKGSYPLGPGYLNAGLEWTMTSPWLYNRAKPPYYYNVRYYYSLTTDAFEYVIKPIGYRYGPDAIVWYGHASWEIPDGPRLSCAVTFLTKGEKTIADSWNPQASDSPPTGATPSTTLALELDAAYPLLTWLELRLGTGLAFRRGLGHRAEAWSDDLELRIGFTARL